MEELELAVNAQGNTVVKMKVVVDELATCIRRIEDMFKNEPVKAKRPRIKN